ncbi:MAG: GNAT family N-acetyltransferase [Chloroflexota bacterium]|nr:GNAT family N-acetyltransferase [Chloroflexota bacterium]
MEIAIREATEGDYRALCEVIEQVDKLHRDNLPGRFKTAEGPARSQDFILNAIRSRDIGLFVAASEGQLVGLVHVIMRDVPDIPILVPRRCGVVDNLAVRKSVRRAGVGHALMARAEAWAVARGATAMELTVYAFNQVAKRFYRRLGYEVLSYRMTKSLEITDPGME